jgi:hypothetical protein
MLTQLQWMMLNMQLQLKPLQTAAAAAAGPAMVKHPQVCNGRNSSKAEVRRACVLSSNRQMQKQPRQQEQPM